MRAIRGSSLRIAQVAPLYESVPPRMYGGTERVVSHLTEALIEQGHDLTLFASGDSSTAGRLVPIGRHSLRGSSVKEPLAPHLLMFDYVRSLADEFDIIHFHNEYMHFPMLRDLSCPSVSTMHGRLDLPEYQGLFARYQDLALISISKRQRWPLPRQNWVANIPHGLPISSYRFDPVGGHDLTFLGRISPEKGVERAIEIALKSGRNLKIAAKIDNGNIDYYRSLRRHFESRQIEYIGEIGDDDKASFLGGSAGLLFPINWPEPFGLVMIEALATGTPVIAFNHGSVPEVIRHGKTGFIVDGVEGAVEAVGKLESINRALCRLDFEERFSVDRMAWDYLQAYERILGGCDLYSGLDPQTVFGPLFSGGLM